MAWQDFCWGGLTGKDHCLHLLSSLTISAALNVVFFFVAVGVGIHRAKIQEHGHGSALSITRKLKWIPAFLSMGFLFRAGWLVLEDMKVFLVRDASGHFVHVYFHVPWIGENVDMHVLAVSIMGKLATFLFFFAFSVLVNFWAEVASKARSSKGLPRFAAQSMIAAGIPNSSSKRKTNYIFIVISVWTFIGAITLVGVEAFLPLKSQTVETLKTIEVVTVAVVFLLLSIGLLTTWRSLRGVLQELEVARVVRSMRKQINLLVFVCVMLFFIRSCLFLWFATHKMPVTVHNTEIRSSAEILVNPWLLYTVPEIIPGMLVLMMMGVKTKQTVKPQSETIPLLSRTVEADRQDGAEFMV